MAVLVDLIGQIFPLRDTESLPSEKVRLAGKQADAIHAMPLGLGQQAISPAVLRRLYLEPRAQP